MTPQQSQRETHGWPTGTLLARLAEEDRRGLLGLGVHRSYPAGHMLIRQGDDAGAVHLLLDALVTVTARVENGSETLVAIRVSGDVVGEMAVIDGSTRFASVSTCRRSLISQVAGPVFMEHLHRHPTVAVMLNRILSERLRQANRRRLDFAGYDVDVRLARAFLELAHLHGREQAEGVDVGVRLSQAEFGALIGAKEGSVQRALRRLAALKLVQPGHRRILILNREALMNFADLHTHP
ncbi:Crp/Fnr family transcriptional regulator [Streptosporangium sp. NPDC002721]|uniref:Crp/Fnr family transcriptional regulator n=1 Tax=Streptosporangium sp. NPDC002721 TaxID=3366188 RepID=UPI00368A0242